MGLIMYNNNKILVVIPARGGSKRIPRKNTRLLADKPLIVYSIEMAQSSDYVDDVVVSTDDSEISFIAEKFGASVIRRSPDLAEDDVPLDPIVFEAMVQKEKQTFDEYDIVVTIQPTSPLLETSTLNRAIEKFDDFSVDSVIGVFDDRHLNWGYDEKNERFFPLYMERVNRQYLPKSFKETGALLATRRHLVHEDSRLGTNIDIIELAPHESVDIANYKDWWVAENYLQMKKVAFVVNAYDEIGTDYIYRCISLGSKLVSDKVLYFIDENYPLGKEIISNYHYEYVTYDGEDNLFDKLREFSPEIVVNDILDTSEEYISNLKDEGYFVCNFEDLGVGSKLAHVVFDDLYEHELSETNVYTGYKYYILKNGFFFQPKKVISQEVNNVLIHFGVDDSNNFTEKVLEALISCGFNGRINVILKSNFQNIDEFISRYERYPSVQIYTHVPKISDFMFSADIIFTSANKSIYEACSLGIPTICLCQNEREKSHVFANNNNGFVNMGLGVELTASEIANKFNAIAANYDFRLQMHNRMLAIDLKHGFENVKAVVSAEYREFKLNKSIE